MSSIINLLWTLLVVGIIIFFHELGHFLAAKKLGIKVQRFSIGFGPKMVGFTRGETEYRISWLPLFGGYVKMLGESPAERPDEEAKEEEVGRFDLAPVSHRAIVAASGPGMNMVFAILAFALAYMAGFPADPDTTIGYVEPDSPASRAGIMQGDRITSVDGYEVKTWSEIQENVMTQPDKEIEITLLHLLLNTKRFRQGDLEDLNNGRLSDALRQELEDNSILFSQNVTISTQSEGRRWRIVDIDKGRRYSIEKDADELNIRSEDEEVTTHAIPERIKPLVFTIEPVISIEFGFQNDLDNGVIPEALRRRLEDRGVLLSSDATLLIQETGSSWLIDDRGNHYPIKKQTLKKLDQNVIEENRLDVHLETEISRFQSDLDNGVISEDLRQRFEDSGKSLSSDVSVLVEEAGSKWLITDGSNRGILRRLIAGKPRRYHVKKEENGLSVYWETRFGMIGISHATKPVIRKVEPGSVASEAGFRLGDVIEAVNYSEVKYTADFFEELQGASGGLVTLTVRRNGNTVEIPISLEFDEDGRLISFEGLSFEEIVRRNPIAAFGKAIPETIKMIGKIFQFLKKLIVGDVSGENVGGPVRIVQITMAVVETGAAGTLRFAGFLSVNLGIVNLLPLFITDGGMIVFLIVEKLRGKRMSRRKQLIIQQIGIGFIVFLFLLVTYNDIVQLISGGF